jgi:hypothetical protein
MLHIPRLYLLSDICGSGKYIPHTPEGVRSRIEKDDSCGGYVARLADDQALRVVRIGKLWAVAETDLVDFLRAAGVRIEDAATASVETDLPQPSRDNEQQRTAPRRPGRPRKSVEF